jgi:hypothetical protein
MSQRLTEPDEDPEKRIELLHDYSAMSMTLYKEEENLISSQSPHLLTEHLLRHENLFQHVKTPSTMTRDCEGVSRIMKTAVSQANAVNLCPKSLNLQNLRANIVNQFGQGSLDLEALGDWSLRKSRVAVPATIFLFGLGEFQPSQRARQARARSQKEKLEAAKDVNQKDSEADVHGNRLLARARTLCDKLRTKGDTLLGNAITTPSSFAQTVQNAFDFAHLVRDGKVGLTVVEAKVLATAKVEALAQAARRQQCVLHLRQTDYQRFIEDPELAGLFTQPE